MAKRKKEEKLFQKKKITNRKIRQMLSFFDETFVESCQFIFEMFFSSFCARSLSNAATSR